MAFKKPDPFSAARIPQGNGIIPGAGGQPGSLRIESNVVDNRVDGLFLDSCEKGDGQGQDQQARQCRYGCSQKTLVPGCHPFEPGRQSLAE